MTAMHNLMSTSEVAALLGLDRSWVIRLVQSGRLVPVVSPTGKQRTSVHMFDRADVEQFAAERTQEPAPESDQGDDTDPTPPHGIERPQVAS